MKRLLGILIVLGILSISGFALAEEAVTTPPPPPAAEQALPAQPASPAVVAPAPQKIDTGDTAWMIVATALVMLMTLPGLALFYGGLAKRKDTLNTMAMSFVTYCIVSILWVIYGFSFAFGTDVAGIIGSTEKLFLSGVGVSIYILSTSLPLLQ
jgi:Amt family ammonium transporter